MDRQGNRIISPEELLLTVSEKAVDPAPRKTTPEAYFSSPAFQRRRKLARQRRESEAFQKKVAFRAAQAQNPITAKPRRKRGRKFRSR
ncbi:MAG: hypothetical protein OXU51_07885 [Candidatus Poribacteria bacterium]|nr:hypothetical protein [Candidatus Poribacteria bacterium]